MYARTTDPETIGHNPRVKKKARRFVPGENREDSGKEPRRSTAGMEAGLQSERKTATAMGQDL